MKWRQGALDWSMRSRQQPARRTHKTAAFRLMHVAWCEILKGCVSSMGLVLMVGCGMSPTAPTDTRVPFVERGIYSRTATSHTPMDNVVDSILPQGQKRILGMVSRRGTNPAAPQPIPNTCSGVPALNFTVLGFLGSTISRDGFRISGSSEDLLAGPGPIVAEAVRFFIEGQVFGSAFHLDIRAEPPEFGYREQWTATLRLDGARGVVEGQSSGTFRLNECVATWSDEPFVAHITGGCPDVAVAVLRGFPIGEFQGSGPLSELLDQAHGAAPGRVISIGVDAQGPFPGSDQVPVVERWLNDVNDMTREWGCGREPRVVLIGHSLGGDAVRRSNIGNTCSRIAIDPIDPKTIIPGPAVEAFNQRHLTLPAAPAGGLFFNLLAESPSVANLLGYHISGAAESVAPGTHHTSIVDATAADGIVVREVTRCLN